MVLNIRYPYIISNKKLYEKTKEMECNKKIKLRRFKLLGHVLRLPYNAPVKLSLQESQRRSKSQKQGNRNSWIKQVNKDLSEIDRGWNLGSGEIELLAEDREMWERRVVKESLRRLQQMWRRYRRRRLQTFQSRMHSPACKHSPLL